MNQLILCGVGILILVNQQIPAAVLIFFEHIRVFPEKLNGQENDIVKIQRIGFAEPLLIRRINLRDFAAAEVSSGSVVHLLRSQEPVLCTADVIRNRLGRECLLYCIASSAVLQSGILDAGGNDAQTVIGVINREVAAVSQKMNMLPENPDTCAVEGCCPDIGCGFAEHRCEAVFQFGGGFIGKGDCKNAPAGNRGKSEQFREALLIRHCCSGGNLPEKIGIFGRAGRNFAVIGISEAHHKCNAVDDGSGFTASGTRENTDRSFDGAHGILLRRVQPFRGKIAGKGCLPEFCHALHALFLSIIEIGCRVCPARNTGSVQTSGNTSYIIS